MTGEKPYKWGTTSRIWPSPAARKPSLQCRKTDIPEYVFSESAERGRRTKRSVKYGILMHYRPGAVEVDKPTNLHIYTVNGKTGGPLRRGQNGYTEIGGHEIPLLHEQEDLHDK